MKPLLLRSVASLASLSLVSACATHSADITPQYTSPMQYQSYSCKQIGAEMQTVSSRVSTLGAENDRIASNDEAAMGVGLILLWPALFFLDKNSTQAAEYARLKGEFDALEKAGIQKNCGLHIERPVIDNPKVDTKDKKHLIGPGSDQD